MIIITYCVNILNKLPDMTTLWIIGILLLILSVWLSFYLRKAFHSINEKWGETLISGWALLNKIKDDYWVVSEINEVEWELTDHFMPSNNSLNLSTEVYRGKWIASVAVALHEFWHAIQHKDWSMLTKIHSLLFLPMQFSSFWAVILFALWSFLKISWLALIGIVLFTVVCIYYLVLSFVEYDASKRAYDIYKKHKDIIVGYKWYKYVESWLSVYQDNRIDKDVESTNDVLFKEMLFLAFMTYFLTLMQSIVQLADMIMSYVQSKESE